MRKTLALVAAVAWLALPVTAATGEAAQTYDLLFRQGTLDEVNRDAALHYTRAVTNRANPETAERDTGEIVLSFAEGEAVLANLQFLQDGKHRNLGSFPASVGNPMIMYFYESVIRDMAESSGGSPFYIRNRVKEALVRPAEIEEGEVVFDGRTVMTRTVTLRPFADDPNRARMKGFGDLELRVVMSDAVPGWYLALVAEAPDAQGSAGGYRSELRFDAVAGQ
ncbi:hypothetical protein M4578_11205 [Salipiger sp. P9]|uniref:hypothetical protein n=1 Tax=Salipiger pentaromativorans TaxID=2943193 RepID=UPI00215860DF|nr:hypothetical protein [Salipiger pentaromativorans]MCR8548400.1 hypothetical protein [Salipiger pentaromativorans]